MHASGEPTATGLVPLLRYRNVAAAVEWLCTAFGVERDALVTGEDNSVIYAQLVWGPSIIMIVSVGQSHLDGLMRQPEEVGGAETRAVTWLLRTLISTMPGPRRRVPRSSSRW